MQSKIWRNSQPLLNATSKRLRLNQKFYHSETASFNPRAQQRAHSWLSPAKLILGFIPIFTFGLGTWQVQRLRWKVAMIEELEEKLNHEPMTLPRKVNLDALPEFTFRRVALSGTWDKAHSILVGPRTRDNVVGYHLLTPLVRPSGSTIIVDRGFISTEQAKKVIDDRTDDGVVEVVGMLRTQPQKNSFTPDNKPEKREWYWADIDAVAEYAGGTQANVQPVLVEEIFDSHIGKALHDIKQGIPVGRAPSVEIRNEHRTYAVTWYSLSAATAVMFWRLVRKGRG